MNNFIIFILYLGVTNSIVNKNDKEEKKKNKGKNKVKKTKNDNKDNDNPNNEYKKDNQYKNTKSKEEKRIHDNKIIKILPPIPEAGLLTLQVIYADNYINDNYEEIEKDK